MLKTSRINVREFVKSLDNAANRYNELINNVDRLVEIVNDYDELIDEYFDDVKNGFRLDKWNADKVERYDEIFNQRVEKINESRYEGEFSFIDFEENYDDGEFLSERLGFEEVGEEEELDDNEYVYGEDVNELNENIFNIVYESITETSNGWEGSYVGLAHKVHTTKNEWFDIDLEDGLILVDFSTELYNRIEYIKKLLK